MTDFLEQVQIYQKSVENTLDYWLPDIDSEPRILHEAMRYSVLAEGKRIRPILLYATGEALGVKLNNLNGQACAVEIMHAYSLIHDDLPSMDDDDLRRGRPTCHKAFDEATAILAGDALQTLAFQILATDPKIITNDTQRLKMIATLSLASGSSGMAGGQAIDLASVGAKLNIEELENMHSHKTGALIKASAEIGALSAKKIDPELFLCISNYAKYIGIAFQIKDDILVAEGATEIIRKSSASDIHKGKATFPMIFGLDEAKKRMLELIELAENEISVFGEDASPLEYMAESIVSRKF